MKEDVAVKADQDELIRKLTQENLELKEENRRLRTIIDALQKAVFGPRTNKAKFVDPDQSLLFTDEITLKIENADDEEVTVPEHKKKKRKRRGYIGKELPVILEIIDLPEEEKTGPDGKPKICIDQIDTDKLEYKPEQFFIRRIRRLKYINAVDAANEKENNEKTVFSIPALPPQIDPKSIFTPSLLAYLIVSKFLEALPLNRIEKRCLRHGYLLSKATMVNGLLRAAKKCEILLDLLLEEAKNGICLLMDETSFQVHREWDKKNKTKSFIWVIRGGPPDKPVILFKYHTGRDKKVPLLYLSDFKGFLQTDAYNGYNDAGGLPGIIHVLCWAHARQRYIEAFEQWKDKDNLAVTPIRMINKLFVIEKRLRKESLLPGDFLARRKQEVEPVFTELKQWLDENKNIVPPKSLLGKAISYTIKHWDKLILYIECPELTPSTNAIERTIRVVVIGRKNYMFFASPRGAYAGMTFYSLIETARANGLEPYKYLKYILEKIPYAATKEDYRKLLPQYIDQADFAKYE